MKKSIRCFFIFFFMFGVFAFSVHGQEEELPPNELRVYFWEDYLAETTIKDFEKESGLKVTLRTFDDEDYMIRELQYYPDRHDLIVVAQDTLWELKDGKLISALDLNRIPNVKNVAAYSFCHSPEDPDFQYFVPYLWGTTGIVVNKKFIDKDIQHWDDLWDEKYKGKIAMLNNRNEVVGVALKSMGYSMNTFDVKVLEEVKEKLLRQKPLLYGYLSPTVIRDKLIENEIWMAQLYSGEATYAMKQNSDLVYIIPEEGGSIWVDYLAVHSISERKDFAEDFIDYLLRPQVMAQIANEIKSASCNVAAREYTDKAILDNPGLYPSKEILDKCERLEFPPLEVEKEYKKGLSTIWKAIAPKGKQMQ